MKKFEDIFYHISSLIVILVCSVYLIGIEYDMDRLKPEYHYFYSIIIFTYEFLCMCSYI